jgi:hypothetical protein
MHKKGGGFFSKSVLEHICRPDKSNIDKSPINSKLLLSSSNNYLAFIFFRGNFALSGIGIIFVSLW